MNRCKLSRSTEVGISVISEIKTIPEFGQNVNIIIMSSMMCHFIFTINHLFVNVITTFNVIKSKTNEKNWVKGRIRSCGFLRFFAYTDDYVFKVRLG